jgi:cytoskeletal protein CcmA (bactofilin family)
MAIPILNHLNVKGNINLNNYKLNDFVVDHSTTGDAGDVDGKLIFDSNVLKFYDGSAWQTLGTASGTMSSWVLEDGDGTEVSIADAKEIKFIDGQGLQIDWTNTSNGTDADPYDLTFQLDLANGLSDVTPANGDKLLTLDSDGSTEQLTTVAALATLFAGSGLTATNSVIAVDTLNQDTSGTAAIATTVTVADESTDTTCFPLFVTAATGDLAPKSGTNLTFNSSSGLLTATAFAGDITGNVTGTSSLVTVTDSNANTAFPLVFHDESNAGKLLDDTGALTYNPSSGSLSVANLTVTGTQTVNNVNVIETSSGVIFEGSTANDFETTLDVIDPTADRAINLPDATGTVVLEDNTATLTNKTIAISQVTELSNLTAVEGAQLENINSVTISNAQWAYVGALNQGLTTTSDVAFNSLDIEGDIDVNGTTNLDAVDIDGNVQIDGTLSVGVDDTGYDVKFFGDTASKYMLWDASADTLILTGELDAGSLDVSGNADIDGTLEADAITVNGTALDTVIDNRIKVVQKTATIDVSSLTSNVNKCSITHGMNSTNLIIKLYDSVTFLDVFADVDRLSVNQIQVVFSHQPSNDIIVVIQEVIGDNIAAGSNITYPSS